MEILSWFIRKLKKIKVRFHLSLKFEIKIG